MVCEYLPKFQDINVALIRALWIDDVLSIEYWLGWYRVRCSIGLDPYRGPLELISDGGKLCR